MSLWAMAGVQAVRNTTQVLDSSIKVYIDDRTVTASSAPVLSLVHRLAVLEPVGRFGRPMLWSLAAFSIRVSFSLPSGFWVRSLLVSVGLGLCTLMSFAVSLMLKGSSVSLVAAASCSVIIWGVSVNLLSLRRAIRLGCACAYWSVSQNLFTATFVAARRVRYSSPWLRALFLGGNLHLDVVWVTRLVAAVLRFRLRSGVLPSCMGGWARVVCRLPSSLDVSEGFHDPSAVVLVAWVRARSCRSLVSQCWLSHWSGPTQCPTRVAGVGLSALVEVW